MMNNIIKFIFLTIIVTNATAYEYDTCLSPRTIGKDCDCDILRPTFQNQRRSGALIEFAICRNYTYWGRFYPLQVLVTPYDPINTEPIYENGKKVGESHWFVGAILPQSHQRINWKQYETQYCPDITIADKEGGDQTNAENQGFWKRNDDGEQEPTELICPEDTTPNGEFYGITMATGPRTRNNYIGVAQRFCGRSTWYQFSYMFSGFDELQGLVTSSPYIPTFINCPGIAAPCGTKDWDCACNYFGDDEVCKNYVPPTTAPAKAPTTDAPRKIEEPQTVGEKIDNDRSSLPWESTFGWIIFAVTMVAAAGMFYTWYRNANNDHSDAIRSGEGAEMGYLPMMEKQ
jgi:hypothetical protein